MMRWILFACFAALLSACGTPQFVSDAPPVPVTSSPPAHFNLPARFAVARVVYGRLQSPGFEEAELWSDLALRAEGVGTFVPMVGDPALSRRASPEALIDTARLQRSRYLLMVRLYPATGTSEVVLYDVGSAAVMATATAASPDGGRRGFWGGPIRNPRRLERTTLHIAEATVPVVEEMLRGMTQRQGWSGGGSQPVPGSGS